MTKTSCTDEEFTAAVQRLGVTQAAKELGISARSAFRRRSKIEKRQGTPIIVPDGEDRTAEKEYTLPDFADDDISAAEIINHMKRRFERKFESHQQKQWFPVKMKSNEPIGLAFVGDPHVDDDGCNWPLLTRDVELLANTPGMHAINIGDTTNNWTGRLVKKYADQESSKKTGYKLAKWLLKDSGVNWLMWLLGNHDSWNDGATIISEMAADITPVFDWQARFVIEFPNGASCPVHAAHNFKGTSIYNPSHGAMRAAKFGQRCPRILMQGHHHDYHMVEGVYEDLDQTYWAGKCRGYKYIDSYADNLQFGQNSHGATVTAIIDPSSDPGSSTFIRMFPDLVQACDFLTYLRQR